MLIRFLDSKETVYQVDTHKTPILIFCESATELEYIHKMKVGDCVMSIPKTFDEEKTQRCYAKLNTKDEPKHLK